MTAEPTQRQANQSTPTTSINNNRTESKTTTEINTPAESTATIKATMT
jgi:hypothetical protein